MSKIYKRQNEKGMLNLLKVQRCLYTKAKVVYTISLLLSLAVWYSDYSSLNKENEILMCQNENIRWDSSLRKTMLIIIAIATVVFIVLLLLICIFLNTSILNVFAIISWVLPVLEVSIDAIKTLGQDLLRLSNIKSELDKAEKNMSGGEFIFRIKRDTSSYI